MSKPTSDQLLLRYGGGELAKSGLLWRRRGWDKYSRGAFTFARADGSTCATYLDRNGVLRLASANRPRLLWSLTGEGPGLLLEDGATNLIENCDVEADSVGWVVSGSATLLRDQTNVKRGAWSVKVTTANSTSSGVFMHNRAGTRIPATVGITYVLSGWVFAPAASVGKTIKVRIEWWSSAPAFLSASEVTGVVLVAGWQRVRVSGLAPASTATADCFIGGDAAQGIWDMWIDTPQFEAGPFETSPIVTGTAAVARAGDSATAKLNVDPANITVLTRILRPPYADLAGVDIGTWRRVFALGDRNVAGELNAYFDKTTRTIKAEFWWGPASSIGASVNIPAGTAITIVVQLTNPLTAPTLKLDVGGGFTTAGPGTPITKWGNQTFSLGLAGSQPAAAILNQLVASEAFTKAEMEAVM